LVGEEVTAPSEEELQLSELFFTWLELPEIRSHSSLISNDMGITSIGFGFATISVASSIHSEGGDVEDPLVSLPQKRQQERGATSWLI
jgi:hypothetical protein